jgi:LysM repeat protein
MSYSDSFFEYTVKPGDTAKSVAQRFGMTEEELKAQRLALTPGSTVRIPCPAGACRRGAFYALRHGDTLLRVSQRTGVTMRELLDANPHLNPGYYAAGQVVVLPVKRGGTGIYTLQPGERLFDVLRRYRVDISTFCALNSGLKPMDVKPGQTIAVPESAPPANSTN